MADTDEPLGKSDEIRTSSANVPVPWSKRQELYERLEEAGYSDIAADLRARRALTEAQKPIVYELLDAWFVSTTYDDFGPHLRSLLDELMRDLKIAPFDD